MITDFNRVAGIVMDVANNYVGLTTKVRRDNLAPNKPAEYILLSSNGHEVDLAIRGTNTEWAIGFASSHYGQEEANEVIGLIQIGYELQKKLNVDESEEERKAVNARKRVKESFLK